MHKIRFKLLRPLYYWIVSVAGSRIVDERTGRYLGRALLVPWRGRILVLGYGMDLVPQFCAQTKMTQWKRTLGFTIHPRPDFPHEPRP